ncbi:predicted protein [Staphylococcus aureus A8115]|nr:predicted protein [Staphylococcus aureus A8115]EFC05106.1 hypothetical protein SGAG_00340 [Staphylococcus aureus A8117]
MEHPDSTSAAIKINFAFLSISHHPFMRFYKFHFAYSYTHLIYLHLLVHLYINLQVHILALKNLLF